MKKKICLMFAILFLFSAIPAKSIDIKEKLSQIGFNIFAEKDSKTEITKVIEKQQKYANKQNYSKLKALYTEDFANYDSVDLDEYLESLKKTWQLHEKLNFTTTINSINVYGNYATVNVVDSTTGQTKEPYEKIEGKGILNSTANSIYYFKKTDGEWRITAEHTYSEKTSLKYGTAKDLEVEIDAPECVTAGSQYDVKVTVLSGATGAIIASITSEPIQYPQVKSEDIFRSIKKDGELERVITSNTDGKNEIAFASLAIAKPVLDEEGQVSASVDGVAFIASRVNVIPKKEKSNEQEK